MEMEGSPRVIRDLRAFRRFGVSERASGFHNQMPGPWKSSPNPGPKQQGSLDLNSSLPLPPRKSRGAIFFMGKSGGELNCNFFSTLPHCQIPG